MHTCISLHGLKRSWRSCPRRVNAGNKNTPSMHHPWRQNVTTLMVGLKNGHIRKNLTQRCWTPEIQLGNAKKNKKKQKQTQTHSSKEIAEFSLENTDVQSNCYWKQRTKSKLLLSSECVKTKHIFHLASTQLVWNGVVQDWKLNCNKCV